MQAQNWRLKRGHKLCKIPSTRSLKKASDWRTSFVDLNSLNKKHDSFVDEIMPITTVHKSIGSKYRKYQHISRSKFRGCNMEALKLTPKKSKVIR